MARRPSNNALSVPTSAFPFPTALPQPVHPARPKPRPRHRNTNTGGADEMKWRFTRIPDTAPTEGQRCPQDPFLCNFILLQ
uniref:Uncharacterized protein n=1 Tax=Knipowitschia caucasica TaxID=637954 RepID=A0AAV2JEF7_KNICA